MIAFDPANPFKDLESDFDGEPAPEAPRTFSPEFSVKQSTGQFRVEAKCPKCVNGTFHGYHGGALGKCFRCNGTGKVMVRPTPSPEELAKRAAAKARKAARERVATEAAVRGWALLHPAVMDWLDANALSSSFAKSLIAGLSKYGSLTPSQIAAVERIVAQQEARQAPAAATPAPVDAIDLTPVPAGFYAVPDGETRLKVQIKKPGASSRWQGHIFVSDGAGYGAGRNYGKQAPGGKYRGQIEPQLRAIAADPRAAMAAYGRLTGSCGVCGRLLEDKESIERGIGPVCFNKF